MTLKNLFAVARFTESMAQNMQRRLFISRAWNQEIVLIQWIKNQANSGSFSLRAIIYFSLRLHSMALYLLMGLMSKIMLLAFLDNFNCYMVVISYLNPI